MEEKFILNGSEIRPLAIAFARTVASRKRKATTKKMVEEFFNQVDAFLDEITKQNDERRPPADEVKSILLGDWQK